MGIAQNATYEMKMKSYVEYWEDILLHLSRPLSHQSATLLEGFGLQVIVNPTILRLYCWLLLSVLIHMTQFNALIVGQKTWGLQPHTFCLKILMVRILFLSGHMILALFLFGWEEHNVMLWKMKRVHFSKWWKFNSEFLWRRVQI